MKIALLSLPSGPLEVEESENRRRLNQLIAVANGLGELVVPGQAIAEPRKSDNALWMAQGLQGGGSLSAPRTRLDGAAGAVVGAVVTFASTAIVAGLDFAAGVTLKAGSVTTFNNCQFRQDGVPALVTCESGALATFVGCHFHGTPTQVVDNPGAIGNITVVGCANLTGAGLGNVTAVGSV